MAVGVGPAGAITLRRIRRHVVGIAVLAAVLMCLPFGNVPIMAEPKPSAAANQPFSGAVAPLSGILPVVVNIAPGVTSPEQARPFFDDFSWRSFIALNLAGGAREKCGG